MTILLLSYAQISKGRLNPTFRREKAVLVRAYSKKRGGPQDEQNQRV